MLVAKSDCRPLFFFFWRGGKQRMRAGEEDERNEQINIKQQVSKARGGREENKREK